MRSSSRPSPRHWVSESWLYQQLREIQDPDPSTEHSDFPAFCGAIDIRLKEGGRRPFRYEDWNDEQKRFEAERTGRDIVLKPRQVGFSTLELARDLWFAIVNPGASVLVLAHEGDLAEQLFLTLRIFADGLRAIGQLPKTLYSNKRELVFANTGSAVRIAEAGETSRSASKKGRSGTVHRLHATEVAFWGSPAETMGAVLQSVPATGEVVIESTANGVGGLFYNDVQAARERLTGYAFHFFPWYQHRKYRLDPPADFKPAPRDDWERKLRGFGCDDAQIAWWRSKVDDPKVGLERALAEYPLDPDTCFRASGDAWFEAQVLDRLVPLIREPTRFAPIVYGGQRFADARIYSQPIPGRQYVVFGDVAEGVAGDGSSAHVLERVTGETAATWWSDTTEPGDFGTVLAVLGWLYNRAQVAPERNNHGHATIERLVTKHKYPNLFRHDDGRPGWNTNPATRPVLWDDMAHAIADGAAWTPDAATLAECRTLIRDEDGKPRARGKRKKNKDACRDDRFVSWAGAWQLRSRAVPKVGGFKVAGL